MCKLTVIETNCDTKIQVADTKKKHIENIIKAAPTCKHILEIILFGSSLETRCTEQSDIDIAIVSDYTIGKLACK